MSFFGKNIKKLRQFKSLSQQAFGDIFDIKRATLGAYEEERSEPKIETIIKIANYFGIPIDDLLTRELKIHQILRLNTDLATEEDIVSNEQLTAIPFVNTVILKEYHEKYKDREFIKNLPEIRLPVQSEYKFMAFEVDNLEMTTGNQGFYPKDIVIGRKMEPSDIFSDLKLSIIVTADSCLFRRVRKDGEQFIIKADHKGIPDNEMTLNEIKEIWQIDYVFYYRLPEHAPSIEEEIHDLRLQIERLKEKF